jgi:hypothetical protein
MVRIVLLIGTRPILWVLLRGIQLTLVQRFEQLYFLINYCCDNNRKARTERRQAFRSATHVMASNTVN